MNRLRLARLISYVISIGCMGALVLMCLYVIGSNYKPKKVVFPIHGVGTELVIEYQSDENIQIVTD